MRRFERRFLRGIVILWTSASISMPSLAAAEERGQHAHEHEHDQHDETETIVVTSSALQHDRDEIAIPVDRVNRRELLENIGATLGESIDHIPGITSSGFTAGANRPVIRGQDAFRTEVLEDGLGTHDVSRESPDHAVPINPLAARRVEVVRGPATLRYGGGANAGVVNTLTNRIPDRLPTESVKGEVFGGIGLLADERDLAATLDGSIGDFAWHADGTLRRANNYSIPNDDNPHTQTGSEYENYAGSIGGSYFHDAGRVGFAYTRIENEYGIPEADEPVEIDMQSDRFRFEGDLLNPIEGIREVRVRGVYSDYEHDEIADGSIGQTFKNEEFEGRLEVLHEPVLGFVGVMGLHGRTRDLKGRGEAAAFLAPSDSSGVAFYWVEEKHLAENLSAEFGFRVEHARVEGTDENDLHRDRDFTPVSGALGLVAHPTSWLTIGAQGSVSQRAPSPAELLAKGPHEATQTFERGDPRLDPETSYNGEIRIEAKGSPGRIEVSAFVTQYDDFIFGELTGNFVDEDGVVVAPGAPDALSELRYRSRDAIFYGGEIAGELDIYEFDCGTVGLDGRFDIVRARFRNGSNRDLPRIVPIRWGGGVFFARENLDVRVGFLRTEAQKDTAPFETNTKSFTQIEASLAYRLALLDDRVPIDLTVVGRNLSDVRGRNHVAFTKDEVLLPGRSIRFGVRARF